MNANDPAASAQIRRILDKQRAASLARGPWSGAERRALIDRAIGLLVDHEAALVDALAADFGHRSHDFSRTIDVLASLVDLKFNQAHLEEWMEPEARPTARGESWVQYQPLGVVGIVTAWNFPVVMVFSGLAGALAAGNRVMIKVSEFNPHTSALLARLFALAFDEAEVAIVTGGPEVGAAFCRQPFDHLLFTGAGSIGKHVLRAAAENLVPVTLELGGKSPTIVSRSADLAKAVGKIMGGKLGNAGQICLAPDYVLVPEESVDEFISLAQSAVAAMFPTLRDNPDYTSIVNARHYDRLQGYLREAREAGVELVEINPAGEDFANQPHRKLAPTLLRNPGDHLAVMQDEIFGPLLPIKPYRQINEALAFINARPRPLGLYYFGTDAQEEALVLERTVSGGVTLGDVIRHAGAENLPFGGVGASGMGCYHGRDGFRTFSHARAVLRAADGPDLTRPPFTEPMRQIVKSMITR